ncbi:unnamed protein product [Sympodiomycopsis kandeliae]
MVELQRSMACPDGRTNSMLPPAKSRSKQSRNGQASEANRSTYHVFLPPPRLALAPSHHQDPNLGRDTQPSSPHPQPNKPRLVRLISRRKRQGGRDGRISGGSKENKRPHEVDQQQHCPAACTKVDKGKAREVDVPMASTQFPPVSTTETRRSPSGKTSSNNDNDNDETSHVSNDERSQSGPVNLSFSSRVATEPSAVSFSASSSRMTAYSPTPAAQAAERLATLQSRTNAPLPPPLDEDSTPGVARGFPPGAEYDSRLDQPTSWTDTFMRSLDAHEADLTAAGLITTNEDHRNSVPTDPNWTGPLSLGSVAIGRALHCEHPEEEGVNGKEPTGEGYISGSQADQSIGRALRSESEVRQMEQSREEARRQAQQDDDGLSIWPMPSAMAAPGRSKSNNRVRFVSAKRVMHSTQNEHDMGRATVNEQAQQSRTVRPLLEVIGSQRSHHGMEDTCRQDDSDSHTEEEEEEEVILTPRRRGNHVSISHHTPPVKVNERPSHHSSLMKNSVKSVTGPPAPNNHPVNFPATDAAPSASTHKQARTQSSSNNDRSFASRSYPSTSLCQQCSHRASKSRPPASEFQTQTVDDDFPSSNAALRNHDHFAVDTPTVSPQGPTRGTMQSSRHRSTGANETSGATRPSYRYQATLPDQQISYSTSDPAQSHRTSASSSASGNSNASRSVCRFSFLASRKGSTISQDSDASPSPRSENVLATATKSMDLPTRSNKRSRSESNHLTRPTDKMTRRTKSDNASSTSSRSRDAAADVSLSKSTTRSRDVSTESSRTRHKQAEPSFHRATAQVPTQSAPRTQSRSSGEPLRGEDSVSTRNASRSDTGHGSVDLSSTTTASRPQRPPLVPSRLAHSFTAESLERADGSLESNTDASTLNGTGAESIPPPPTLFFDPHHVTTISSILEKPTAYLSARNGGFKDQNSAPRINLLAMIREVGPLEEVGTKVYKHGKVVEGAINMTYRSDLILMDCTGCLLKVSLWGECAQQLAGSEDCEESDEDVLSQEYNGILASQPGNTTSRTGDLTTFSVLMRPGGAERRGREKKKCPSLRPGDVISLESIIISLRRNNSGANTSHSMSTSRIGVPGGAMQIQGSASSRTQSRAELCWRWDTRNASEKRKYTFDPILSTFDRRCKDVWKCAQRWKPSFQH